MLQTGVPLYKRYKLWMNERPGQARGWMWEGAKKISPPVETGGLKVMVLIKNLSKTGNSSLDFGRWLWHQLNFFFIIVIKFCFSRFTTIDLC